VAALAGLLFVLAFDIIDLPTIRRTVRSSWPDAAAFFATLSGTLVLTLDQAIYLGVGISLVLFLRRARLLVVHEIGVDPDGRVREIDPEDDDGVWRRCRHVRMLHVEGRLFFGVEGELRTTLEEALADPAVRVLLLRLKRTLGMDATIAALLLEVTERLHAEGRHLLLAGVRNEALPVLDGSGLADAIGSENIFHSQRQWFGSMNSAMARAYALAEDHSDGCPLRDVAHPRRDHPSTSTK
jgi:SulP family sulfate permease